MRIEFQSIDFLHLQKSVGPRIADPLNNDVISKAIYEGGNEAFFQITVDGGVNGTIYEIQFGKTYVRPPIVLGTLRLTETVSMGGSTQFNSGEYITLCDRTKLVYNVGKTISYKFYYVANQSKLQVVVTKFKGVASFLCVETIV